MSSFDHFRQTRDGRTFMLVWVGQLVSTLGSSITQFGLAIWVFTETGSPMQVSFIVIAGALPSLLMSPFAGALVDRWDRRIAMIFSDTGAGLGTIAMAVLFATNNLEMWHLYVALSFSSLFVSFQFPAYSSATTLLVPKDQYGRAAGMVQLAGSVGIVAAPALAGLLVVSTGLTTIFIIDFVSFVFAVGTLLLVRFPRVEPSSSESITVLGLLREAKQGLSFVTARRGLFVLLLIFAAINFAFGFIEVLMIPLLLTLTSEAMAGVVVSVSALGLISGSLFMSVWGGSSDKIRDLFVAMTILGATMLVAGSRPTLFIVFMAITVTHMAVPVASSSSQALWMAKVPKELQGRVFAVRQMVSLAATPVAFLLAGILAEGTFEPLLMPDGALAANLGQIVGTGEGRGMGLLISIMGAVVVVVSMISWRTPAIRNLDTDIRDAEVSELLLA